MTTNFIDVFIGLNTASNGAFGVLLPAAIWICLFIGLKMFDNDSALLVSSFFATIIALILWRNSIATFGTMLFWIIATMIMGFITFISR